MKVRVIPLMGPAYRVGVVGGAVEVTLEGGRNRFRNVATPDHTA